MVLKADEGGKEIGCVDWGGEGVSSRFLPSDFCCRRAKRGPRD